MKWLTRYAKSLNCVIYIYLLKPHNLAYAFDQHQILVFFQKTKIVASVTEEKVHEENKYSRPDLDSYMLSRFSSPRNIFQKLKFNKKLSTLTLA